MSQIDRTKLKIFVTADASQQTGPIELLVAIMDVLRIYGRNRSMALNRSVVAIDIIMQGLDAEQQAAEDSASTEVEMQYSL